MKKYPDTNAFPNAPGLSKSLGLTQANEVPKQVIGWGPWKYRWHSICSKHHSSQRNIDCKMCLCGSYSNVWKGWFSGMIYNISPKTWIWWVNRK